MTDGLTTITSIPRFIQQMQSLFSENSKFFRSFPKAFDWTTVSNNEVQDQIKESCVSHFPTLTVLFWLR